MTTKTRENMAEVHERLMAASLRSVARGVPPQTAVENTLNELAATWPKVAEMYMRWLLLERTAAA